MMQSICVTGLIAFTCAAFGQSGEKRPAFEAASIKPAPPPTGMGMFIRMGGDAGRINYENVSIKDVIRQAYQVKDYQITGPDWLNSVRYNIVATMPPDTPKEQVWLMLQTLLEERFQLTLHRETKELPAYALVVGKNGPKMKPSEAQGEGRVEPQGKILAEGKGGPGPGGRMMMRPGGLEVHGITMSGFAEMLSRQVGRPVLDMTELKGAYDFKLEFTPDENQKMGMMPPGLPMPMGKPEGGGEVKAEARAAEGGPSLFAALQEQLGLKLESRKGPVEILVIDHVEKTPTEN